MRWVAALLIATIVMSACTSEDKQKEAPKAISGTCGLPKVSKNVDPERVPEEFLLEGGEIARTKDFRGRFIATINAPYQVTEAFKIYREQVADAGWRTIQEENEGFEAELYFATKEQLAAVQIRTSTCDRKIVVFVSTLPRDDIPGT